MSSIVDLLNVIDRIDLIAELTNECEFLVALFCILFALIITSRKIENLATTFSRLLHVFFSWSLFEMNPRIFVSHLKSLSETVNSLRSTFNSVFLNCISIFFYLSTLQTWYRFAFTLQCVLKIVAGRSIYCRGFRQNYHLDWWDKRHPTFLFIDSNITLKNTQMFRHYFLSSSVAPRVIVCIHSFHSSFALDFS